MVDLASNQVPFEVLIDPTVPARIGLELEVYQFDDPTQLVDVIPRREDVAFLDEIKGPGGGAFSISKNDAKLLESPGILNQRNLVKCRLDGQVVGGFLIRDKDTVYVTKGEYSDLRWKVSGEGLRSWTREAVVLPYGGVKQDSQGSRVFSFASERGSWYKTAEWKTPVNVHQYTMDPGTSNPWGTAPAEWPDVPEAFWIWGVDNSAVSPAPIGTNFFRYEFQITESGVKQYSVFCAGDDDFDIYMDAAQIITSREKNGYAKTWRADFDLGPGTHILAARVKNNGGVAALIAALFQFGDAEAGTAAKLLTCTGITATGASLQTQANSDANAATVARTTATAARLDATNKRAASDADPGNATKAQAADDADTTADVLELQADAAESKAARSASLAEQALANETANLPGWKVNPYPDPSPGWTPGEVMLTLINEAVTRGVRSLGFLTPTFTTDVDSDGTAWPRSLDWQFSLGTEYFEVISRLEELVCDVWIDPSNLEMNMYIERGTHRDVQSAAVQPVKFEIGHNVLKAEEKETSDIKNTVLMETADGWELQADGLTDSISKYGRIEGFISTGASSAVSGDVAQAVFKQKATPEVSATFEVIDLDDARPFVDYFVGDWSLAPGKTGLEPRRVMSVSLSEDAKTGRPKFALEFDTIFADQEQRYERWLQSTSDGTLGGSLANTSSGGGGGSSSPTPSSQTTQRGPQGLQGKPGPAGITWRGTWSPAIEYSPRNGVNYAGSAWYAVVGSVDEIPGSGSSWSLLALAGAKGDKGDTGTGLTILGVLPSVGDLPTTGSVGDAYTIDGALYVWSDEITDWIFAGDMQGIPGDPGDKGDPGFIYVGRWSSSTAYPAAVVVTYASVQWLSNLANTNSVPTSGNTDWSQIATPLPVRDVVTYTTGLLAADESETGFIPLALGFRLLHVEVNKSSRIRLYTTAATRDADEDRPSTLDPTAFNNGLLWDFSAPGAQLVWDLPIIVDGFSSETPPSPNIPITITNLAATPGNVSVTLTYVRNE